MYQKVCLVGSSFSCIFLSLLISFSLCRIEEKIILGCAKIFLSLCIFFFSGSRLAQAFFFQNDKLEIKSLHTFLKYKRAFLFHVSLFLTLPSPKNGRDVSHLLLLLFAPLRRQQQHRAGLETRDFPTFSRGRLERSSCGHG